MEAQNQDQQLEVAPVAKPFYNEVFGYTLVATVVVCTYTIINLVAFLV